MKYLGDTEQSSPSPELEIGCKYWLRSKKTGEVKLLEAEASILNQPCFIIDALIVFERFDVFGPVIDEVNQPDFGALKKESTDNWLKDMFKDTEVTDRDFFNIWTSGKEGK